MHDKWYLKDWNLTLLNQCLNDIDAKVTAYYTTRGMITHYIMWTGYKNGNKSYIMFDNGGELNIFGIGFEFENQKHSMPLPVNGTPKMTGVLAVSHRLVKWIADEEIDYNYIAEYTDTEMRELLMSNE